MTTYRITDADENTVDVVFETDALAPLSLQERDDMVDCYRVLDAAGEPARHAAGGHAIEYTLMTQGPFAVVADAA